MGCEQLKTMKIIIACGGTGGHLFPGVAVAQELKSRGHEVKLLISQKKVDARASEKYKNLDFDTVPAVAKPKTLSLKMLPFMWKMWKTIGKCKKMHKEFQTDAVVGLCWLDIRWVQKHMYMIVMHCLVKRTG